MNRIDMKKLLVIIGLLFLGTIVFAQEMPNDIKRYDFKKADKYDGAHYSVLKITDCVTDEKEYKLKVAFSYEENKVEYKVKLIYSDGIVAEIIKAFNYLINTKFELKHNDEESFIICELGEGAYFKYDIESNHIDLMVTFNNENRVLAGINRNEIEEFKTLLFRIEKSFAEMGRDLKDVVNTKDKKEPVLIQI